MIAILPKFFLFKSAEDLTRIGRKNDGGYLVSKSDIRKSEILISLGIFDDISFEKQFIKNKDIDLIAYDGSLNIKFWLKRVLVEFFKNPFNLYALKIFLSFKNFFKGKRKLIKKFVGLNTIDENYCTLSSIIDNLDHKNIFLKIDIEGYEYRILDTLILNQDIICGLVIEFHDCDIHLEKIENFIKNFKLKLVHIHGNNFTPIRSSDKLPLTLELTFSKYCNQNDTFSLPHKEDMPNNKLKPEFELKFDN